MRSIRGRCRRVNLGYADNRTIDPQEWASRQAEGIDTSGHRLPKGHRVAGHDPARYPIGELAAKGAGPSRR